MERKAFITTAAGVAGLLATAAAALAAPTATQPTATMAPNPYASHKPWQRDEYKSNRNIRKVRMHLEHVIDELQHDQHDYAGHRVKALDLLQQARQELLLAEQSSH